MADLIGCLHTSGLTGWSLLGWCDVYVSPHPLQVMLGAVLCHAWYISLGDLSRYQQQLLASDKQPDWSTSRRYAGLNSNHLARRFLWSVPLGLDMEAVMRAIRSIVSQVEFPSRELKGPLPLPLMRWKQGPPT